MGRAISRRMLGIASVVVVIGTRSLIGVGWDGGAVSAAPVADAGAWTVYHHDPAGTGVAPGFSSVTTSRRAWSSPALDGQLYGEPLVAGDRVYAATEDNVVYALASATGAVVWSNHLAPPVPATSLPCGDIEPNVGITGTPVLDTARGEIFVVADELVAGRPVHRLVGLDMASGRTMMSQVVDPPGADAAALLQRSGLTLDQGDVVLAFGGNYGDCASYRGRVVAVPEAGGTPVDFTVDAAAGESQGAIWMGGAAPAVDGAGNIWVGVGNGSVYSSSHAYDHSDSVLELSPSLHLQQYFAPAQWASDNSHDLDLSMEPVLLADGQVLIAGKARIAYLLDGADLGGIGGQSAQLSLSCSDDVDGGSAAVGSTVYLPCLGGVVAVAVGSSPASIRSQWNSTAGGGPPIVAAGRVWTIGQNGVLYGLDPATGSVRQQAAVGAPANHFPTPSVGDGLLLAPAADRIVAFTAAAGAVSTTTGPTSGSTAPSQATTPVAPPASAGGGGGIPPVGIAGIVVGGLVVLGVAGWLWRRRRGRPASGVG